MSRPEAKRRARELRQEYRATGVPFSQSEFHTQLFQRCADLADDALDGLVAWAATKIDQESTRDRDEQPSLFDMDGDYKIGDGMRIAKEHAQIEHHRAALSLKEENLEAVQQAYERECREFERLRPYYGPGVRKYEAVARYLMAHPEDADQAERLDQSAAR